MGVSEKCVRTTIFNNLKGFGACESDRSGRPPKLNPTIEKRIFTIAKKNPEISLRNLALAVSDTSSGFMISKETIRKTLLKKPFCSLIIRKPFLTLKHRLKRKHWCKERLNWSVEKWKQVIFSDESNFQLINSIKKPLVKRLNNEKYLSHYCRPKVQYGERLIGIWGCVSSKGTGVPFIHEGRINQKIYINTLENCLLPSINLFFEENETFLFQQDDAKSHPAKSVEKWLEENNVQVLLLFPRSPDQNPVENL